MQTYQSTPDYYNDYIRHGWLKDAAAKAHKYIERWRGKNGKWYYRYKSKASSALTKVRRNMLGTDAEDITTDNGRKILQNTGRRNWSGKPDSRFDSKKGLRRNAGISEGRKRAIKKGVKIKGYSGNLSSRGYSTAEGKRTSKNKDHYDNRSTWRDLDNRKKSANTRKTMTSKIRTKTPMGYTDSASREYNQPVYEYRNKNGKLLYTDYGKRKWGAQASAYNNHKKVKKTNKFMKSHKFTAWVRGY